MLGQLRYNLREFVRKGDLLLLALCVTATLFGVALIYSATRSSVYYDPSLQSCALKQLVFLCMGLVIYVVFTLLDFETILEKSRKLLFAASVGFLLLLKTPLGVKGDTGNLSWLDIPGLPFGVQPAELIKIPFILLLAFLMDRQRERGLSRPSSVFLMAGYALFFIGLNVVISGDFGMSLAYLLIFACMALGAGVAKRWFVLGCALVAAAVGVVVYLADTSEAFMKKYGYIIRRFTEAYTRTDPQGIGWQQNRSVLAIGSGQLTGQGFLKGTLTQSSAESSLPARHTDEIFAVCGEEFGLIGCLAVLLLLAAILIRCFWVAASSRNAFCAYAAIGFASMILIQTAINVAMCLYLFPVVGLTLPFFSYGGSSILTLYAAMGIVSGIKTRFLPSWLKDRSKL